MLTFAALANTVHVSLLGYGNFRFRSYHDDIMRTASGLIGLDWRHWYWGTAATDRAARILAGTGVDGGVGTDVVAVDTTAISASRRSRI